MSFSFKWPKGKSRKTSVPSPKPQTRDEPAPRFTNAEIDQMRAIVAHLSLDIDLYQQAEAVGDHLNTLWDLLKAKPLVWVEKGVVIESIEEIATAFRNSMRGIDRPLSYINKQLSRFDSRKLPDVEKALKDFKRARDNAQTLMNSLQHASNDLHRSDVEESDAFRECQDRFLELKGAVDKMHGGAPSVWHTLHNDISDLVRDLERLIPS